MKLQHIKDGFFNESKQLKIKIFFDKKVVNFLSRCHSYSYHLQFVKKIKMGKNTYTCVKAIQHILGVYLIFSIFREQFLIVGSILPEDEIKLCNPYLSSLLTYYSVVFMNKSKLLIINDMRMRRILTYSAPAFILLVASLNLVGAITSVSQIFSVINGIIFPEFILTFIYLFEPNYSKT